MSRYKMNNEGDYYTHDVTTPPHILPFSLPLSMSMSMGVDDSTGLELEPVAWEPSLYTLPSLSGCLGVDVSWFVASDVFTLSAGFLRCLFAAVSCCLPPFTGGRLRTIADGLLVFCMSLKEIGTVLPA